MQGGSLQVWSIPDHSTLCSILSTHISPYTSGAAMSIPLTLERMQWVWDIKINSDTHIADFGK